ncbi:hypothetical protein AU074_13990 [Pseudomonas sp. ATCC PTA-122608]|uniref:hypothetical protein n=1 Tax=Pseudomonas sp. ATCC PTA-122608 TaxID=1771311 RepID=UPI00096BA2F6|nr:hypothetical protein [Pseudomonas sp. ATCC PTA-122608]OLY72282.1 hypothetical protein AU074_13990 [Pseudomonas sp. ATCC PTA-122608]
MSQSNIFLEELVRSYKLERILSVEIQHSGLDTYKSIHHKIQYFDNSGISENLSVSIQDLEGFFGVILHQQDCAIKLVYKNKNKVKEKWDDETDDTARFIIPDGTYRSYDFEEDDEIYRVFEIPCEACTIRIYVKVNSESAYNTAFTRFRGKLKDLHHHMEFYPIEASFKNKLSGETVSMHGMRDNGFMGRDIPYIYYTNQIYELDDSEEYLDPERQYVHIRAESSDTRKDISFRYKISVIPEFHFPNDESAKKYSFVVHDFEEAFDEAGCWVVFEDENYSLTFSIRFDAPLQDRIEDIAERFKE